MIPDNYSQWLSHELQQERELDKLPKCDHCGRSIQDEYLFDIYGEIYCERCANLLFKKLVQYD